MILYLTYKQFGKYKIIKDIPELHKSKCYNNKLGSKDILYQENRNLKEIIYSVDHEFHNENGPAFISYNIRGELRKEDFYYQNKLHNLHGPAVIYYYNGTIIKQQHYINGIRQHLF
jgi:antitoxin component YwqK of YwqJK toxin-antitoxin module